jgi:quinate dehydrogenase (quinone)
MASESGSLAGRIWAAVGGVLVGLVGLALGAGGAWLVVLGGSPYYLLAGVGVLATGVLLVRRRPEAGLVYAAVLAGTIGWALWEAGLEFWRLLPRLLAPGVLGLFVLLVLPAALKGRWRGQAMAAVAVASIAAIGVLAWTIPQTYQAGQADEPVAPRAGAPPAAEPGDWRYYGRDPGGQRYAPVDQINRENVSALKVAWTFRTGQKPLRGSEDQNTPVQVGDSLYVCTPTNVVIALEADTGRERWRFDPKVKPHFWNRCRGVGYWEAPGAPPPKTPVQAPAKAPAKVAAPASAAAACQRRIFASTIDARLIALDAATGRPCAGFGKDGVVDLKVGMGPFKPGFYFQTSQPTVAGDRILIGGWVADNQELAEPAGVVRAFDARTGEIAWAWDIGDYSITKLPPEGKTYTRGTPNVWSTPAFDAALGLVYLPTGNATPDYWGSHRSSQSEVYASSIVALEIATGREKWRFQTTHHDLWDYDVPAQPMLVDYPTKEGTTVPALIALTKRGQIFVLDRRTGQPVSRVVEVSTPHGAQPGEWVNPTQPYSADLPSLAGGPLMESMMWGATPLDQLWCRITFRRLRYEGDFTPPGSPKQPSLQYPGNAGGQNWGSGAYDARRNLLIVPNLRMPQSVYLEPSNRPELALSRTKDRPPMSLKARPYKARNDWLLGPAMAPCLEPPNGELVAVDLTNRRIAWEVPAGTAEESGIFGIPTGLPIPLGTIGLGGAVTTAGGITFHAATTDPYLRAYDNATGKVVWQARLPAGVGGTPMTFVSPKTGKQYVVVSAGGARMARQKGDYVVAFTLPENRY